MKKILSAIAGMALILNLSVSVWAGSETTTMNVQATVPEAVTVSASPLDFGPLSASNYTYANSTITVNAASGLPYHIAIDAGQHYFFNFRHVEVSGGTATVTYWLFKDDSYGLDQEWGDSDYGNTFPEGSSSGPHTGDGTDQVHTVYGRAHQFGGSIRPAGTYTDAVTVTVHY
ncbi:MAG: spore coat protein U domain-containing protein [Gemmatimonadota bacterium]|nr:MAG: spore coat protein U domain-containing protein [Gemmatimonadota bacterium]